MRNVPILKSEIVKDYVDLYLAGLAMVVWKKLLNQYTHAQLANRMT